jgi:hypothetical protein
MKAERAKQVATLARAFRCSVADIKAMTLREIDAMIEVLQEEARAAQRRPVRR